MTTHGHLVPRLRMSGAVPLLYPYDFMVWTGTNLPFQQNLLQFQESKPNSLITNRAPESLRWLEQQKYRLSLYKFLTKQSMGAVLAQSVQYKAVSRFPVKVRVFFFNNQPDALIIHNLFCHKTLHVSGNFFAHHQEFSTVYSALASFMQGFYDRFQTESG